MRDSHISSVYILLKQVAYWACEIGYLGRPFLVANYSVRNGRSKFFLGVIFRHNHSILISMNNVDDTDIPQGKALV